jgi:hypothetical protein
MTATHNIKVNGRWYHPGEELPESNEPKAVPVPEVPVLNAENAPEEEPKTEPKRTTTRRKTSK